MKFYKKKTITRNDGIPYLIRYSIPLLTNRFFAVKIHHILISDDACLHDHPWNFISILLKGSYSESRPKLESINSIETLNFSNPNIKKYNAPNILYRKAEDFHRLVINKPVWSLVITFKKRKSWGFFSKQGWIEWFKYNDQNSCES